MEKPCVFCQIVRGQTPTEILHSTENLVVFRDIHPQAPVHLLIVPKKHIRSVNDLAPDDHAVLGEMLLRPPRPWRPGSTFQAPATGSFVNVERGGGQVIFHLHMHLIGGWGAECGRSIRLMAQGRQSPCLSISRVSCLNAFLSPAILGEPMPPPGGIYVHVPFCLRKCAYCDFFSITDLSLKPAFLEALSSEISAADPGLLVFDTIYIGGGTPSILEPAEVKGIIDGLFSKFRFEGSVEVTLEANPGTVDFEKLKGFRSAGVNRLNIGVQSFQEKNLALLGRIHSAATGACSPCERTPGRF